MFRHYRKPEFLGNLNKSLSVEEKFLIHSTPFGWLILLDGKLKLSHNLLRDLCSRWVEKSHNFAISSTHVPFTMLDGCLDIGLRVVGEKIGLAETEKKCERRSFIPNN